MAIEKRYAITLDLYERLNNELPIYVQQDFNFLDITVLNRGSSIDLIGKTAVIKNENGDIFGGLESITIVDDVIIWALNNNAVTITGVIKAEVRLITSAATEEKVTTFKFEYKVRKELADGEITPDNDEQAQVLEDLIAEVNEILDETDDFMTATVYDPTNVIGDAFSMGNMVETGTEKIFTDTERDKLTDIEEDAQVNVQSDWNQTVNTEDDFIKNKPSDVTDLTLHSVTELNNVTDVGSGAIITTIERDFIEELQAPEFTDVTLENAFNKLDFIVDGSEEVTQIRGRTLNNPINNGIDYVNWTVAGTGTTKGTNGIHLVADGFSDRAMLDLMFEPSTQYTLIYNIKQTNLSNFLGLKIITSSDVIMPQNLGINKLLITTTPTITLNSMEIFCFSANIDGEFVDFEILGLLEGDQTTLDIQNSLPFGISGSTVDSLKTLGKNIFKLPFGSVTQNGVTLTSDGNDITINGTATAATRININEEIVFKTTSQGIIDLNHKLKTELNTDYNYGTIAISGSKTGVGSLTLIRQNGIAFSQPLLGATATDNITDEIVGIYIFIQTGDTYTDYKINVQIEDGTSLTAFEAYQEYIEPINQTIQGFNNVFDTIEETSVEVDSEIIKQNAVIERNQERLFIGDVAEGWANVASALTNVYRFDTSITTDAVGGITTTIAILEGITLDAVESDVLDAEHYYIDSSMQVLNAFIDQSKIDAEAGATLLDKYHNFLLSNNLDLLYNLNEASYIKTALPDYNNNLPCYTDGHLLINYTNVPSSLDVNYPTNKGAQWDSTTGLATSNAKQINNIWTTLLPIADKELAMAAIDLLTVDTNPELKDKINEIINVWKV